MTCSIGLHFEIKTGLLRASLRVHCLCPCLVSARWLGGKKKWVFTTGNAMPGLAIHCCGRYRHQWCLPLSRQTHSPVHSCLVTSLSTLLPPDPEELVAAELRHGQRRPRGVCAAGVLHHLQHVWAAGQLPAGPGPDPHAGPRSASSVTPPPQRGICVFCSSVDANVVHFGVLPRSAQRVCTRPFPILVIICDLS